MVLARRAYERGTTFAKGLMVVSLDMASRQPAGAIPADPNPSSIIQITYTPSRIDLASRVYLALGLKKVGPDCLTTARLVKLCEFAAMLVMPGVSLGNDLAIKHTGPAVRGSPITITATCALRDRFWTWQLHVADVHETIATGMVVFLADLDRPRYKRRLARKLNARPVRAVFWLLLLDALGFGGAMIMPAQVAYLAPDWWLRIAALSTGVISWVVTLRGIPTAVRDWFTIRVKVIESG